MNYVEIYIGIGCCFTGLSLILEDWPTMRSDFKTSPEAFIGGIIGGTLAWPLGVIYAVRQRRLP